MKTISLIVPVFNEAAAIPLFLTATTEAVRPLEQRGYGFEFIFINDGSTDATLECLLKFVRTDPRLHVIDLSRNFGKEAAMSAGLNEASGDAVIPIDVDLQDPPAVIPQLIEKWEQGAEVVLARKTDRSKDSFFKRQTARWFYRVHNAVADPAIPEDVGDFRLLDRCVVDALQALPEQRRFMKGLFAWIGFHTATVTYQRSPRSAGKSRFTSLRLWRLAIDGITSFSIAPLRIWIYMGVMTAGAAFVYMVYTILKALIHGIDTPGYASLLATVLFLGGIQLIGIGVLGEYLGRTYIESKRRPTYVVRARYGKGEAARADADRRATMPQGVSVK